MKQTLNIKHYKTATNIICELFGTRLVFVGKEKHKKKKKKEKNGQRSPKKKKKIYALCLTKIKFKND